jgi:hypothetical protein
MIRRHKKAIERRKKDKICTLILIRIYQITTVILWIGKYPTPAKIECTCDCSPD